jgi:hypothetical protein
MPQLASVVTPARFDQGLTYADFVAQAAVNRDKFEQGYADAPLTEDDLAFFRRAAARGASKVLAIAETWCGDVYRELPTMARIADAAGMTLRVFLRDANPDIMDEFLSNEGKSRAIPVFVFYTDDLRYITHFTERSASAHADLARLLDEAKAKLGLPAEATLSNLNPEQRQELLKVLIPSLEPHRQRWRKDAIGEMRELLARALKMPEGEAA